MLCLKCVVLLMVRMKFLCFGDVFDVFELGGVGMGLNVVFEVFDLGGVGLCLNVVFEMRTVSEVRTKFLFFGGFF